MNKNFNIQVGDIYLYTTNNGVIEREVTDIGFKRVGYINNGKKQACLKSTFKRWWKGAELIYRIEDEQK